MFTRFAMCEKDVGDYTFGVGKFDEHFRPEINVIHEQATIIDKILRAVWVFCYARAPCPHCNVVLNQVVLKYLISYTNIGKGGRGIYTAINNL